MGHPIRFRNYNDEETGTSFDLILSSNEIVSLELVNIGNDDEAEIVISTKTANYNIEGDERIVKELYEGLIGIRYIEHYYLEDFFKKVSKYNVKVSMKCDIIVIDMSKAEDICMYNDNLMHLLEEQLEDDDEYDDED